MIPSDIGSFFIWLGTAAAASAIISWFLTPRAFYQKLSPEREKELNLAVYIVLGLLSFILLHYVPNTLIDQLQPFYAVLYAAIAAWAGDQAHETARTVRLQVVSKTNLANVTAHTDLTKAA